MAFYTAGVLPSVRHGLFVDNPLVPSNGPDVNNWVPPEKSTTRIKKKKEDEKKIMPEAINKKNISRIYFKCILEM